MADPLALVNPRVREEARALAARFRASEPFPHVVIDGLLDERACRRLAEEFPPFERGNAIDENGRPGGKSTFERVAQLGPGFAALDALAQAPEFLALLGEITGVPKLLYDPDYVGGGTHENLGGQRLDFHVDFNRHPRGWDRRLNLLLYLNDGWDEAWGGCLELRRDPRVPAPPIAPLFNRAVLFETSERSWHGFRTIRAGLPSTRRSIAFYFYTEELRKTPSHSTIYVEEPADPRALERVPELLVRRMENLQRLERREQTLLDILRQVLSQATTSGASADPSTVMWALEFTDREIARLCACEVELRAAIERAESLPRLPLGGHLRTVTQAGLYHDGWIGPKLDVRARATGPIGELMVRGVVPRELERQTLRIGKIERAFDAGPFEWRLPFTADAGDAVTFEIVAARSFSPRRMGASDDARELAWHVHLIHGR